MSRAQFTDLMRESILRLPSQLKETLRLFDDPDIPDEGRVMAAGALLHWLSGSNTIPGARGEILPYVDDVLVLRLCHEQLVQLAPDVLTRYRTESPELWENLEQDLAVARDRLGEGMTIIERALARIGKLKHRGQTAEQCVRDVEAATGLYDEVQSALVDLDLEEDEVARELRNLDGMLEGLRQTS
jgi:hypothetical protein